MANVRCTTTTRPRHLLAKAARQMSSSSSTHSEACGRRSTSSLFPKCDRLNGISHIKNVLYTLPHGNEASQDHQAPKNTASESNKTSDRTSDEIEQATTNRTFPAFCHGSDEEPLESHPEEQLLSAEEELPESSSSECKVGPGTSSEYKVLSVE